MGDPCSRAYRSARTSVEVPEVGLKFQMRTLASDSPVVERHAFGLTGDPDPSAELFQRDREPLEVRFPSSGTISTSVVTCAAPCNTAASPPMST